jgi:peptide/nickel transport system permease protein
MGNRSRSTVLRSPLAGTAAVLLVGLVLVAVLAPMLMHTSANRIDVAATHQGMSAEHPFGTDRLGRDILARTLVATRLSLWLAIVTSALGAACGVVVGTLPVVVGRQLGRLIVSTINLLVAFPGLLLALFLAMIFGVGARGAVLALAVAMAPGFARLTHTTASRISRADFVAAARMLGVPRRRLISRHILPNIAEPLIVNTTTAIGSALMAFSALSYLGFGVQSPSYDWGRMLFDGLSDIYTNPAAALLPSVAIVIAGITFVMAGEVATQVIAGAESHRATKRRSAVGSNVMRPDATDSPDSRPVLCVENLCVTFPGRHGEVKVVDGVSFSLEPGEMVGVVGESGSGKSLTGAAIGCLVPYPGKVHADALELLGEDLQTMPVARRDRLLGTSLATVFQDPMSALNPALRVGRQLAEVAEVHQGAEHRSAMRRAVARLDAVKIPAAERRARQYPSEFSGGMRQRAVIGMGLMVDPVLIIADEPTTALDVTVQGEVLDLLRQVRDDRGTAVLFISHDIAVIAELASRVLVMYAGRIVEDLPVGDLVDRAAHPYTRALVASVPDLDTDRTQPLSSISGRPPDPREVGQGCAFAERCPLADDTCLTTRPPLATAPGGRRVACWHPQDEVAHGEVSTRFEAREAW